MRNDIANGPRRKRVVIRVACVAVTGAALVVLFEARTELAGAYWEWRFSNATSEAKWSIGRRLVQLQRFRDRPIERWCISMLESPDLESNQRALGLVELFPPDEAIPLLLRTGDWDRYYSGSGIWEWSEFEETPKEARYMEALTAFGASGIPALLEAALQTDPGGTEVFVDALRNVLAREDDEDSVNSLFFRPSVHDGKQALEVLISGAAFSRRIQQLALSVYREWYGCEPDLSRE